MIIELKNYKFIMDYIKKKDISEIIFSLYFFTLEGDSSREIYFRDYYNAIDEECDTFVSLKENNIIEFVYIDDINYLGFIYELSNRLFIYDDCGNIIKRLSSDDGEEFNADVLDEINDITEELKEFTLVFEYIDVAAKRDYNVAKFYINKNNPEQSVIEI